MKQRSIATARILFAGVIASFSLLLAGLVLQLWRPAAAEALRYTDIPRLPAQLEISSPTAFLHLGLLVLMAAPFARIVVLLSEFIRTRDYAFALIAIGVLLLLGVSMYIGLT